MRLGKTISTVSRDDELILWRRMIGLEQSLVVDLNRCCGCGDCQAICPAAAVSIIDPVVEQGRVVKKAVAHIDPASCTYCGQCVGICPTKCISWRENQETVPTVITAGILPALDEEIHIDLESCRADCELACVASCPVDAIRVSLEDDESGRRQIKDVSVSRERCLYCRRCQPACPYGAIRVKASRSGLVILDEEKCPPNCRACADVCPTGALFAEEGHVALNEDFCIYCRACTRVCPTQGALEVRREMIRARMAASQIWPEMLEKLISPGARLKHVQEAAAAKRARAWRTRID
jgi:4Fe-4S ferredoxin